MRDLWIHQSDDASSETFQAKASLILTYMYILYIYNIEIDRLNAFFSFFLLSAGRETTRYHKNHHPHVENQVKPLDPHEPSLHSSFR